MAKILIGIQKQFSRNLYKEIFEQEGFKVLTVEKQDQLISWTKIEEPNIIILDIGLFQKQEKLEEFIKISSEKKIPVIAYAIFRTKENKDRAIKLQAKEFITPSDTPPGSVVRKAKILLGEQKTYLISINETEHDAPKLLQDLSSGKSLICEKCGKKKVLYLMRDLDKGKNYYKISIVCHNCK